MEEARIVDCRSEEGITLGLIDAILSISRILVSRNLKESKTIEDALLDLCTDEDLAFLLQQK